MMGTYSNTTHMIPEEANAGASVPRFGWFYPGSFYSAPNSSPAHPQGTQIGTQQGISVTPICTFVPAAEPAKDNNAGTKTTKAKKPKPSVKSCNQIPPKTMKSKKPKKASSKKEAQTLPAAKRERRNLDADIEKMNFDLSGVPSPFCSCTGIPRVCYKWGAGGWQSSCCTTSISEHPLPMSPTRPGARLAGRKMSNGAYLKLLLKLAAEGYDLSHPVDLKHHWARHGTNKFVTIK
ncbi:protein BASIC PENTACYSTEINE7 [Euphorbia lathyris]|uniref:protein BASIC PENTACYSTEINE7 n=1 Tax=Euphorbia lathyris TaxID=212925 RepID=UPI003313C156